MRTVYVDRRDSRLTVDHDRLLVDIPEHPRPLSLPLLQIKTVVIASQTTLDSRVLLKLSECGIGLVVLNPTHAEQSMMSIPNSHGHSARRLAQYRLVQDEKMTQDACRSLVLFRLKSQIKLLMTLTSSHPHAAYKLRQAAQQLRELWQQYATNQTLTVAQWRGVEGSGARMFFAGLAAALPAWTAFTGRNRRPPKDPVNVLLSLTYTIVHAECVRALYAVGLDPMLGVYHQADYGRASLACDLTEMLRSHVDRWVVQLIAKQFLLEAHFSRSEKYPCVLGKAGRAIYYEQLETQIKTWRRMLRLLAHRWAERVLQSMPEA